MKYRLLEEHKVRLSDKVLKPGVYTLSQLEEFHKHDSLEFCIKHTKLGAKLEIFNEKTTKNKTNHVRNKKRL